MNVTKVGSLVLRENMTDWVKKLKENPPDLSLIIRRHAFNIEANAAMDAPVDTGALKNSIKAEAVDANNWIVQDGVEYGIYQELGTSRGVPATHFLGGATEREAEPFYADIEEALKKQ